MKKILLTIAIAFLCKTGILAQAVYVDCNSGNDSNKGTKEAPVCSIDKAAEIIKSRNNGIFTIKINPGLYVLDHHLSIETEKNMAGKHIIIEASILPDDLKWTPDKMPVIINKAKNGEPCYNQRAQIPWIL
jgi:hypothetical protein